MAAYNAAAEVINSETPTPVGRKKSTSHERKHFRERAHWVSQTFLKRNFSGSN